MTIQIRDLKKQFGEVEALKGIGLDLEPNEIFGFIGPDGSGKTTLFRIITSLLLPDSGTVTVNGLDAVRDFRKIRRITGYMPGRFSLYPDLSVEENLNFYARIFKTSLEENYGLIKNIYSHIEPFRKRRAGALSGGMKQKLALSCALIHKPDLLILDEPTTGVDAVSRREFWELLKEMQEKGITILVSTPYMDEASLCDRIALMQQGNLLAVNTPAGITGHYGRELFAVRSEKMHPLVADLKQFKPAAMVYRFGEYVHLSLGDRAPDHFEDEVAGFLIDRGHRQPQVRRKQPVIEDCFLALMDKNLTS